MALPASYVIFKDVASLSWPGIGMFRARYFAGTELYGEWSDTNAAECVKRSRFTKFERCDRETWLAAQTGQMNGWAETSDAEAVVHPLPLTDAGRHALAQHEKALEAYRPSH